MKHILIILFTFFSFIILAQGPTFEWAKGFGGTNQDNGNSITVDPSGNVYSIGFFQGTVDFDPGAGTFNLTSSGSQDIYIQKLDDNGDFVWAKSIGGTGQDEGFSLSIDASGNVYTTGRFEGTVDFDPGTGTNNLSSNGGNDVFVLKLDASGNFLWAKSFGSNFGDYGLALCLDISGNVYTTGWFVGTVDFDPGAGTTNLTSNGDKDVFIQKLDASGNFLWAKSYGGAGTEEGTSITVDDLGNIYTTGFFNITADFDPGIGVFNLSSAGLFDVFIQKLDNMGDFVWAKAFGGIGWDSGSSISINANGDIYTTGFFKNIADFDPGPGTISFTSTAGSEDFFVQKLDASGNYLWASTFGGSNDDRGNSIDIDQAGNIYITGFFEGSVDFDPGTGSNTPPFSTFGSSVFIQKLDDSGNLIWVESFGLNDTQSNSIIVDVTDNVYLTGSFISTEDFDPSPGTSNLTSVGTSRDVFIHKMSQCQPNTGTDVQTACDSYTWIDGNTYTTSNNSATWTLTNQAGCDSVVTLDLTINNSTTGTDVQTTCDNYTWIDGNTYTASNNTATWTLSNAAGCDSVVTLDLTINNVSDITTNVNGITISANNSNATYAWLDCDNNYAVINGETNASYTPTANGNYAVELTENGCVDTSACAAITTVGIIENTFNEEFTIYPNPTEGLFSIEFKSTHEIITLKIVDASGKLIDIEDYNQIDFIEYELNEPNGIYLIEVSDGRDQRSLIRLIKQ